MHQPSQQLHKKPQGTHSKQGNCKVAQNQRTQKQQSKTSSKEKKDSLRKYGNIPSEQSQSSSCSKSQSSQQINSVTKQDTINYDKRRRRDRDQMILAYKIEYLLFLLNGKKIIRKQIRAKPLVGPRQSRRQEWTEAMDMYNKLFTTLQQQIKCKSLLLKKICKFGIQKKTAKKQREDHDSLTGQRRNDQSQHSAHTSPALNEEQEEEFVHSLNQSFKELQQLSGKDMKHEYSVCFERLKEVINLKAEIQDNLNFITNRPSNNLKRGKRGKYKLKKTMKKIHYFNVAKSIHQKNMDNKSKASSLISQQKERENGNRRKSLRPRKVKHEQTDSDQSREISKQKSLPKTQKKKQNPQKNIQLQVKKIPITTIISPPNQQKKDKKQKNLQFQNQLISQTITYSQGQKKDIPQQKVLQTVTQALPPSQPKISQKKHKNSSQSLQQSFEPSYKQFLQFKKYMKLMQKEKEYPRYRKREDTESSQSSSQQSPYIKKIIRTVKRVKNTDKQVNAQGKQHY